MEFVRKVYGIVCCQLLATFVLAAPIAAMGPLWAVQCQWLQYFGAGLYLGVVFLHLWWRDLFRKAPWNHVALVAITLSMSITIGLSSAMYTRASVLLSAGLTTLIFMSLTLIAWKTGRDFTGWAPFLYSGFLLFLVSLCLWFFLAFVGFHLQMAVLGLNLCGVAFVVAFIIVDTQMILGEWGGHRLQFQIDDYYLAALQLYLDIGDLFLYVLHVFGVNVPGVDLCQSSSKKKKKESEA